MTIENISFEVFVSSFSPSPQHFCCSTALFLLSDYLSSSFSLSSPSSAIKYWYEFHLESKRLIPSIAHTFFENWGSDQCNAWKMRKTKNRKSLGHFYVKVLEKIFLIRHWPQSTVRVHCNIVYWASYVIRNRLSYQQFGAPVTAKHRNIWKQLLTTSANRAPRRLIQLHWTTTKKLKGEFWCCGINVTNTMPDIGDASCEIWSPLRFAELKLKNNSMDNFMVN